MNAIAQPHIGAPAELILQRLEKVKPKGNGKWTACCPAHTDKTPSLSITEASDGKVLLHCFSGCETRDVMASIGLEFRDLFPEGLSVTARLEYRRRSLTAARDHARLIQQLAAANIETLDTEDLLLAAQVEVDLPRLEAELQAINDLGDEQEEIEQLAPTFDNELPGRLADLQLAIFDRMRKPSAIGSAMVALTVCGHLLGRRALGPTGLGCNLYSIVCADTGRGKDALVGAPGWLMEPLSESLQATIAGQFSSRPALHEHLMDQPCTLSAIDEIGHMLKAIGNPRDSHMHDLGGFMMELFSAASKTINPRARRKAKGITDLEPVKHPHFSLVGATTPTMLGLALSSDMTAAGQLNRLLICCLDDWNGYRQKPKFGATPEWWGAWVESLHTTLPANGEEALRMTWTRDTESFFWAEEERRDDVLQAEAVMVRELRQRDSEHALKIAQIVVLADHRTEVTRADLMWSFSFVDRLQWAVLDLCRREGILQGSSLDAVAKTAVEHLRKNGPKTEARLSADCRPFGATKSGDRQHVLRLMRESFGVQTLQTGRGQKLVVPK